MKKISGKKGIAFILSLVLSGLLGVPCALSVAQLVRRNAFFLGGPRSGKSNAIKLATEKLLAQLQPDDFAIIFDPRGDYLKEFYSAERGDLVLSTLSRHRHITESWNVWEEILSADAYRREMFIREIVSRLVKADDPSPFPALTQIEVYGTESE